MAIKLSALRDRRPKSEPIVVETSKGNKVEFINFMKIDYREATKIITEMDQATNQDQIEQSFKKLAKDGEKALKTFVADEEVFSFEDAKDVLEYASEEMQRQSGTTVGESQA